MRSCYLLCAVSVAAGALVSAWWFGSSPAAAQANGPRGEFAEFTPEETTNIVVYEKVNRSVVNITTKAVKADVLLFLDAEFEGSGSGSVLDRAGHILTNHHVVAGAKEMQVTLFNGETFDAVLVGHDAVNDIAVLKISAPPDMLFPVAAGDSGKLRVGQQIYAVGNPFGLERTLTVGIISSLNRSLPSRTGRSMKSIIQIDAALNRGNSGGPLLDSRARLIGMNTAIASSTGENTGVGFAIPVNTIMRVVPQLIEHGRVTRPDIGITKVYQAEGRVVIAALSPGGPAERAGLRGFRIVRKTGRRGPFVVEERSIDRSSADVIVAVDGQPVKTADDLLGFVEMKRPGESVELTIMRENREAVVPITLAVGE
jgi:S1-C subfamily serine protease